MKKTISHLISLFTFMLFLYLALCMAPASSSWAASDTSVKVAHDDADINSAIQTARTGLKKFWEKFSKPEKNEVGFALKVAIKDGRNVEHFWLQNIERKDSKIYGVIDNQPGLVKNVQVGQKIEINEADISDWTYLRDGKLVGNYTLRVLIKRLAPEQAKEYEDMLVKE